MFCVKSNGDSNKLRCVKGEGVFGNSSSFYMSSY